MSASQHDPVDEFVRAMGPIARELLGEPNETLSSKDELRFGNRGSLSVRLDKGTWYQHGGSEEESGGVIDLVMQRRGVDKAGAVAWLRERGHLPPAAANGSAAQGSQLGEIVASYDYRDEHGELLFQVCRFEPKNFRQRRPDATKRDGWNWSTKDCRRVLFRLPEVLEAVTAGRPVYVVEGEKAALALTGIGLDATCSPGGAGKWRDDYAPALARARVVILPDHDQPGRDHADQVEASLRRAGNDHVRIVHLPGLADKQDVADWIAAGGAWRELEAICDTEGAAKPPTSMPNSFADFLSAEAWQERDFPPPVRLLGDLVTTTSRAFLVGSTGLGKTMFGMAIAAGMASGQGFLDWRCDRPVRVLYVDGEMPGELVKARLRDAARRLNGASLQGNLSVYCADTADAFAAKFPSLGRMDALNKESGQNFIYALIDKLGGVDCVIFDNVMSLVAGDQKDEVPWSETLPLVGGLTSRNVGQIWFDHTGHLTARQYGSSTKAWRFDAVGVMTELPKEQRVPRETAFNLSFDAPGKARRRTPDNWQEFAPRTIRLAEDAWTSDRPDGADQSRGRPDLHKVAPSRAIYHEALLDAVIAHCVGPGTTTMAAWESECIRRGLVVPPREGETNRKRLAKFWTARTAMVKAGYVGVDGDRVGNLVGKYDRFGG